jgi:hypothetical protein
MKIKSIKNNIGTWFNLPKSMAVVTPKGYQEVNKFYFNGFEPTYEVTFDRESDSELYKVRATGNHPFRLLDKSFTAVEDLVEGMLMDNGWLFRSKELMTNPTPTMDMEVPEEHCYTLDNGIISHNTAGLQGGVSEGINPDPAMVYTQTSAGGEMDRINPQLLSLMKERNVFNKKIIFEIRDKMGSVQHVNWLSEDEKRVFKTAFEINQEVIIRLASQRAQYIDQWQSLNLFFSSDEDEAYISKIHRLAFEDENILGLYYVYSQSGVQASKDECESCM